MGKKSLIKSTSKKKTESTDPAPEKTANTDAQSAKPVKEKPVERKAATVKKETPKKAATKKSTAKSAAKKKAPATVKKAAPKKATAKKSTAKPAVKKKAATSKKAVAKTEAAKPAVQEEVTATMEKEAPEQSAAKADAAKLKAKEKAPATAKETAPKKVAKVDTAKPDIKKEASPKVTTETDAAKPEVKKSAAPVEEKTTPAPEPVEPKVADTPKPETVEAQPTTTAPPPKKETPPPPEKAAPVPPVQAAAVKDAVKESSPKPAAPIAKTPEFTQSPERPEPSPEDQVQVSYDKPLIPQKTAAEPTSPIIKYGAIGLAFLIFLVVGASITNSKRYYIKKRPLDIEISKGEFSPIGKNQLLKISGVAMPETTKAVYSRNDAYPMIFQYYLNHADALLENTEAPDYDAIKVLINKAQGYAVTPALANQATRRLAAIDLHHLFYKASVTSEKGTIAGYDEGLDFLARANRLSLDESQQAMVDHKITEMKDARARIQVEKTVKEIMTAPPIEEGTVVTH